MAAVLRALCLLLVCLAAADAAGCPAGSAVVTVGASQSVSWRASDGTCFEYRSNDRTRPQVVFTRFRVDFPEGADHPCMGVSVTMWGSSDRVISSFTEDSSEEFTEVWSGANASAVATMMQPYGRIVMKVHGEVGLKCRTLLRFTGTADIKPISGNLIPGFNQQETPQLIYTQRFEELHMISPNYPDAPPNDLTVLYVIDIDYIRKAMVCVKDIDLPRNVNCDDGYLWLHTNSSTNMNIRLCGSAKRNNLLSVINGVQINIPSSTPDRFGCVYRVVLAFGRKFEVLFDTTPDVEWMGFSGFKLTSMDINTTTCRLPFTAGLEYSGNKPGDLIPYSSSLYYRCLDGYTSPNTNNRLQCIENGLLDRDPAQACVRVNVVTTKFATRPWIELTTTDQFGPLPSSAMASTPMKLLALLVLLACRLF